MPILMNMCLIVVQLCQLSQSPKRCMDLHILKHLKFDSKIVSEYDQEIQQYKPQTSPWHRKEETLNHHETPGRQIKQSKQLSLPHQNDCNTWMDIKSNVQQNIEQFQTPTMGVTINKKSQQQNHRLRTDSSLSHQGA